MNLAEYGLPQYMDRSPTDSLLKVDARGEAHAVAVKTY